VVGVEPVAGAAPRVRLRVSLPEGAQGDMLRRTVGRMYAQELAKRVGLKVRHRPWGKGIRVDKEGDELLVTAKGLGPSAEAELGFFASDAAASCNSELGPDGKMGKEVRKVLDMFGV
jgi:hypothetical protein